MVQRAVKVISSQGNIFTLQQSVSSLRNLLTQQNFPTDVSQKILNCLSEGTERLKVFYRERFVEKSKKLSEVIHKVKLPPLSDKFIITDIICERAKQKEKTGQRKLLHHRGKSTLQKDKETNCEISGSMT